MTERVKERERERENERRLTKGVKRGFVVECVRLATVLKFGGRLLLCDFVSRNAPNVNYVDTIATFLTII